MSARPQTRSCPMCGTQKTVPEAAIDYRGVAFAIERCAGMRFPVRDEPFGHDLRSRAGRAGAGAGEGAPPADQARLRRRAEAQVRAGRRASRRGSGRRLGRPRPGVLARRGLALHRLRAERRTRRLRPRARIRRARGTLRRERRGGHRRRDRLRQRARARRRPARPGARRDRIAACRRRAGRDRAEPPRHPALPSGLARAALLAAALPHQLFLAPRPRPPASGPTA